MEMNDLVIASIDDHLVEPPDMFRHHLPADVEQPRVVEIEGGGALVEQRSIDPAGDSIAACPTATSDHWYLADGFTVDGSLDQVILTNPFEQTVVANLEFATREGSRRPGSYSGLTVPPRSTRVIDLGAPGAGAQSEPILAVSVETTRGLIEADVVGLAVAGNSSRLAAMAGVRLPIESHVLQAMVTEPVKPFLDTVVTSGATHLYISQTDKGEVLLGGALLLAVRRWCQLVANQRPGGRRCRDRAPGPAVPHGAVDAARRSN